MHKRDRELLARMAKVNTSCGEITVQLLTMQPDDAAYAAGLLQLGHAFRSLGEEMTQRALELDPQLGAAEEWPQLPPSGP